VNEELACSWFTANPVHCLRSKFVHKHEPHASFWVSGKEHLQNLNPDINCYFADDEAEAAAEDSGLGLSAVSQRFSSKLFKKKEEPKEEKEDA